jgi:Nif-specific regulatory protein
MAKKSQQINEYTIIKLLEQSNYAEIYKVQDKEKHTLVLKCARTSSAECNELIQREYQILAQFKHPNIVSVYDYDTFQNKSFFTLEYVKGKPINDCFNNLSEDFLSAVIQVINGLSAFHNKGFIHSDLKPEHILYDAKGKKAVLIDFGFAQADLKAEGAGFAGTLGYMAPEVIKGINIDQRSDIYSLGVVIYEILKGNKPAEVYEAISGVSDELNNLMARCISREPAIRPAIPEIYHVLSKYMKSKRIEKPGYEVRLPSMGFVESPEITDKLLSAANKTMIINSDTGMGKTRLLQELKFRFLSDGYSVLLYSAHGQIEFLKNLQKGLGIDKNAVTEKEALSADTKDSKFQVFEELNKAIIAHAKHKKTVLMVDDLDCLSDYELGLFRYLGYGTKKSNVLMIGAAKPHDRIKNLGFVNIELNPFTFEQTQKLVEKTFFEIEQVKKTGTAKQDAFARFLHKQSGGTPLFVSEILKNLYENKTIYYKPNKWYVRIDDLDKTKIPSKIEDLLAGQLKSLKNPELSILKTLALAKNALEPMIMTAVLGPKIDIEVEHLKQLGILNEKTADNRRSIRIANHLIEKLIIDLIPAAEEKQICNMLIKTLEPAIPEHDRYIPVLAELSARVNDVKKAYKYSEKAAQNAITIYDYDSATGYYKKMAEYAKSMDPKAYPGVLLKIAEISQKTADNKTALQYFKETLKLKDKKTHAGAYKGLGMVYSSMGDNKEASKYLKKALGQIKNKKTADYITTTNRLAYSLMLLGDFESVKKLLDESLASAKKLNDIEMTSQTLYYQVVYEWFKGSIAKAIKKAKEYWKYSQENKLLTSSAYAANLLSQLYQQENNLKQAQNYSAKAIDIFKQTKRYTALVSAMLNQAAFFHLQGDFSEAKELYERSLAIALQTGNKTTQHEALLDLGAAENETGNFDKAIDLYKKTLEIDPDDAMSNYHISMVYYKKGELEKARTLLEKQLTNNEFPLYYTGLGLIALISGNLDDAKRLILKGLDKKLLDQINNNQKLELFLKASQFYNEIRDFNKAMQLADQALKSAQKSQMESTIASAFIKINSFQMKQTSSLNINNELKRLKDIGCIYDHACLRRLMIETCLENDTIDVKQITADLNEITEIFSSLNAKLELERTKKLQERLYPVIVKDYSRRAISTEYLDTFSQLAELISLHLGDEDFLQNTLDLIIQTTGAERGALFIKTKKAMEFAAGRNMDQTTIKDAGELSLTAIESVEKQGIIFTQDALADPDFSLKKSVMVNQIHSLLCIPLVVSSNTIGAVYLDSRLGKGIFGPQDKDFLLTVSRILASVIEKSLAFTTLTEENIMLKSKMIQEIGSGYLVGKSRAMKKVYQLIEDVAKTTSPVVLLGETGTGKGMLARLLHLKSARKKARFLTINCGTIPETLLESELFGHKKGAFTGAVADKKGLLEAGEGGTVFLDEITNTSLAFQAKLLEAIEEKIIRRIGETETRKIDVRFLFATNRNLEIEVEEGRFRKDLFYRINVFSVEVPPLRERVMDIPILAQFFLQRYTRDINKPIAGFTQDAVTKLKEYFWPGNVRELQNVIERAVVLAKRNLITSKDLGFESVKTEVIIPMREIKKEAVIEALTATEWNIKKAAELLQIGRKSIYRYMQKFGIPRKKK